MNVDKDTCIDDDGKMECDKDTCIGCQACVGTCPVEAISPAE